MANTPEVRAVLKTFCDIQREKYGPDWKAKLSAEMAAQTAPFIEALFKLKNK